MPLEALYEKYKDKGLVILGFPCNQFAAQEPGTNEEIEVTPANYNETLFSGNKNDVLYLKQKLYLQRGTSIIPINKKTMLLEVLNDKKAEVTNYMKKERLSFKKKQDMSILIAYYNQLI